MEIAGWLQRLLPKIESYGRYDGCWVAHVKTRTPAHNPPLHWLGRALDAAESVGAIDLLRARSLAAHGAEACAGGSEQDQRLQDVLTEACAMAWTAQHLGAPQPVEVGAGGLLLVHAPSVDARLAPRRVRPARTLELLLQQVQEHVAAAATDLPEARGRILYLDLNLTLDGYALDVGYDGPLTEPVREWLKHCCAEHGLGWVLTRSFEWGVPLECWY